MSINSYCCVCWEKKTKKSLIAVQDTIEKLVQTYVYSGYMKEIAAYPSSICGNCKTNLYMLAKRKKPPTRWTQKIEKVRFKLIASVKIQF